MRPKVYIDGEVGTTGLRIRQWLSHRTDLEVLSAPEAQRKDPGARRERILGADVSVLCLPDDAAREAASWVTRTRARLIDASTAHRVAPDWVYGLPELATGQRDAIRAAQVVSNPGCYASAFILLMRPLVDAGVLSADTAPSIHALSGYSGGGRALIQRWEGPQLHLGTLPYEAPYAYTRVHKHIPEMVKFSRLHVEPQFLPSVGPFACGMRVQVGLPAASLDGVTADALWQVLHERYAGEPFVHVMPLLAPLEPDEHAFDPRRCNDTNQIELHVVAHPSGHVVLVAILDNLGKGAAGVAIQSLNLMLGLSETTGLPA